MKFYCWFLFLNMVIVQSKLFYAEMLHILKVVQLYNFWLAFDKILFSSWLDCCQLALLRLFSVKSVERSDRILYMHLLQFFLKYISKGFEHWLDWLMYEYVFCGNMFFIFHLKASEFFLNSQATRNVALVGCRRYTWIILWIVDTHRKPQKPESWHYGIKFT